ncbi:Clp_N domain-containing protein [Cephalotus follicularis]|uniref:Clp_N domain-containing protein n=1 Tax=Cephalotus follicularis TaxID=3775 RepID=A0A1Q3AVF7_CEPFO|nr:Clp_N domain-containing protein [Cephalotus follicularis]
MRSGACAAQQTLTTEAASVLKHSLSLARRRGHAQVTPLHVAATLLSSRTSLLRRACIKSQPHQTSHPLQCRALELCFNVALNRLPTTPGPLLHGQPSLSNALIAALKRAQAHQRRGCIEQQQQQPLLTVKVELEQLIISILDDPSVSRVMREAGFSSTAVKNNLEDSSSSSVFQCYSTSGGVFSSPCSPSPSETQREIINPNTFWQSHFLTYSSEQYPLLFPPQKNVHSNCIGDSATLKEDIKLVFEVLLRKKRRNTIIVGDSVSITEGLVAELMGRVERGEVPNELKRTRLFKFQFSPVALRFMKKEDVDMNLSELKGKVNSLTPGEGAIIYTGDLKWAVEESVNGEVSYSPVDHLVTEIGRIVCDYDNTSYKVWLVGTASYHTYMRCQTRQPPLEIQWALQVVSVPSGGLGLSLHGSSVRDSRMIFSQNPSQGVETKPFTIKDEQDKLICCSECTSNYEKEAHLFKSGQQKLLPPWLQPNGSNVNQKDYLIELRRKWNRSCHTLHQGRQIQSHLSSTLNNNQSLMGKSYSYASSYPWWPSQSSNLPESNSISFIDSASKPNHSSILVPKFRRQNSCTIEFNFGISTHKHQAGEPSLDSLKNTEEKELKITLALGNSLLSDSGKSENQKVERTMQRGDLSKLLQENVPWQSESIPSIVEALIDSESTKKDAWLLIQGNDSLGKRRLARAIAVRVMGSADLLLHMNMRNRDNEAVSSAEILARALRDHEKLVVLVEDVDLADTQFLKLLADRLKTGNYGEDSRKREENVGQAIFILTNGDSSSYEARVKNNQDSVIKMTLKINESTPGPSFGTPKYDHKRKGEWHISNKIKSPKLDVKEDTCSKGNLIKKSFSRQSSSNTLDLNMKANEDEGSEDKPMELSPISSDLTRETATDVQAPSGFIESIKNSYVFYLSPARDREMTDVFLSKIKGSFEDVFGVQNVVNFSVEERVLEGVLVGSGFFVNTLFDNWLKDILQTTLQTVKIGGKGNTDIKLSFGGIDEKVLEGGYMGTCLPKKIQVSFMD